MIEYDNQNEEMVTECDRCCYTSDEYYGEYRDCVSEAKEDGWIVKRNQESDEWEHFCSEDCLN